MAEKHGEAEMLCRKKKVENNLQLQLQLPRQSVGVKPHHKVSQAALVKTNWQS
jgi:hypothetical protein